MASNDGKQTNIVANKARHLIFFEGNEFCYNYKTGQWTEIPAYNGLGMYSANSESQVVGLVRYSGTACDLQMQTTSHVVQTAELETTEKDYNPGGRCIVTGVRPLANGGTYAVRAGSRNNLETAVSYSTSTSVNSRTGYANFRHEGRYVRAEITVTGGFTSLLGADIDIAPAGQV